MSELLGNYSGEPPDQPTNTEPILGPDESKEINPNLIQSLDGFLELLSEISSSENSSSGVNPATQMETLQNPPEVDDVISALKQLLARKENPIATDMDSAFDGLNLDDLLK